MKEDSTKKMNVLELYTLFNEIMQRFPDHDLKHIPVCIKTKRGKELEIKSINLNTHWNITSDKSTTITKESLGKLTIQE